ncbi:hypothetical protein QAD02_021493 [Eretmocerus hayati]|uniref:Uncharacterized protein n=1 Tax=Eretmocerus hayati TaxID=131215 RepID=A0ACC2PQL2_9HYME|nr:hypothetical protein QAD02_021493 [Eretmocerus hayati]
MTKTNQIGAPVSGIPHLRAHLHNIPGSNQVKGKTNIVERHFYLKDATATNQNSHIPTRNRSQSLETLSSSNKETTVSTVMEVDDTGSELASVGNEGNDAPKSAKQMTNKLSMKRPADDCDDANENRSTKRDHKDQQPYEARITSQAEKPPTDENVKNDERLSTSQTTPTASQIGTDTSKGTPLVQNESEPISSDTAKVGNNTTTHLLKPNQNQPSKREFNKFKEFNKYDRAPHRMYLQNADNSQDRINPLLINEFLIEKFQNRDVFDECYPLAKNKVCIVAKSLKIANEVLKLADWQLTNKSIFIPNHLMTRQGIIKNVPIEFSETDMLENLEANDPLFGNVRIMGVRRFTRRNIDPSTGKVLTPIPTRTVQVTFRGQYIPPRVTLYKITMNTELYYPQVRQCYRCYNFGHLKVNCKSATELCQRCADPVHSVDSTCPRRDQQPMCKNCKGGHIATDKSCEARKRQQEIRDFATENNLSISEAKRRMSRRREYVPNINEFPALSNRWSALQDYQDQETCDTTSSYAAATLPKKNQSRTYEHKNYARALHKGVSNKPKNPGAHNSYNKNDYPSQVGSHKYAEIRNQHRSMLINPNGHIPNMSFRRSSSIQSTQKQHLEVHTEENSESEDQNYHFSTVHNQEPDLRESIEIVNTLLENMSIEKLYRALDTIASYRNREYVKPFPRGPDISRKKQSDPGANEDDKWKLEYSNQLPVPTGSTNFEAPSQVEQTSHTLTQQTYNDPSSSAGKEEVSNQFT